MCIENVYKLYWSLCIKWYCIHSNKGSFYISWLRSRHSESCHGGSDYQFGTKSQKTRYDNLSASLSIPIIITTFHYILHSPCKCIKYHQKLNHDHIVVLVFKTQPWWLGWLVSASAHEPWRVWPPALPAPWCSSDSAPLAAPSASWARPGRSSTSLRRLCRLPAVCNEAIRSNSHEDVKLTVDYKRKKVSTTISNTS